MRLDFTATPLTLPPAGGSGHDLGGRLGQLGHAVLGTITDPAGALGGAVAGVARSAVDPLLEQFAKLPVFLMKQFAQVLNSASGLSLSDVQTSSAWQISLYISGSVAFLVLLLQTASIAIGRDGTGLGFAVRGLIRYAVSIAAIVGLASAGLAAADGVSSYIVAATFSDTAGLQTKMVVLFGGQALISGGGAGLVFMFLFAFVIAALTLLLWVELFIRNAAIVVLVVTSPIAAAGSMHQATSSWAKKTMSWTIAFIVMKPVLFLCLAIGVTRFGEATDLTRVLLGGAILAVAGITPFMLLKLFSFVDDVGLGAIGQKAVGALGLESLGGMVPGGSRGGSSGGGGGGGGGGGAFSPDADLSGEQLMNHIEQDNIAQMEQRVKANQASNPAPAQASGRSATGSPATAETPPATPAGTPVTAASHATPGAPVPGAPTGPGTPSPAGTSSGSGAPTRGAASGGAGGGPGPAVAAPAAPPAAAAAVVVL